MEIQLSNNLLAHSKMLHRDTFKRCVVATLKLPGKRQNGVFVCKLKGKNMLHVGFEFIFLYICFTFAILF